jgi:hypothetical protein
MSCINVFFIVIHFLYLGSSLFAKEQVLQCYIEHPDDSASQVEFFYAVPEWKGPFPVLFLLSGYQPEKDSLGGKELVNFGYLERFVNEGILPVSISVPGFGGSSGKRDFCGPYSQKAVHAVIQHFKNGSFVDPSRMGVYGISRGAILGGMVSAYCEDLSLQILESGEYDLLTRLEALPAYLHSLRENLLKESGGTIEALKERSCLYHVQNMHQKTLILHGEFDDRKGIGSAKALHQALLAEGVESHLKIYLNGLHCLGPEKWEAILPFLREHFFQKVGVGIGVVKIGSAVQISKIHPGTSADLSNKLRVGDTVLGVSGHVEDPLINALGMPIGEFVSHLLGKKGTLVHLQVQHYDGGVEEILVERSSQGMF